MKQTAVEWLGKELEDYGDSQFCKIEWKTLDLLIEQAKEMEKEQHGMTWDKSMDNLDVRGGNIVRAWDDFDEYYNKTYKQNDK